MKKILSITLILLLVLTGCSKNEETIIPNDDEVTIELSNDKILVNGEENTTDSGIMIHNNIRYYKENQAEGYGEGEEVDSHSQDEADAHTVIEINKPGTYRISGSIDKGQILIDLGDEAKDDPTQVVNLILDDVSITSTVAPAILVVNAYECSQAEVSDPLTVDTTNAGFNLIFAENSDNFIAGSYVAKIYKEGTTEKLYKYDASITSLVSMNVSEEGSNGRLIVTAENEGIESAMHLTINSGTIEITSGDDALNASEDNQSVMTINGGNITLNSTLGDEGDGADSNGWIVINNGNIVANANPKSADGGLDADLGIYINGGIVVASGQMLDEISKDSTQLHMILSFMNIESENKIVVLKDQEGNYVMGFDLEYYGYYVISSPLLTEQDYTLYLVSSVEGEYSSGIYTNIESTEDEQQLGYSGGMFANMSFDNSNFNAEGNMIESRPMDIEGERPEEPSGERPEGMPDRPTNEDGNPLGGMMNEDEVYDIFSLSANSNTFMNISIIGE